MRTAVFLAALALSLAAGHTTARADASRAWAAAKAGLPADARFVIGFDVAALQKTQLFATFYPKLHDAPDAAKILDAIKDICKLDPAVVVSGMVVGMSSDQSEGAAYLALSRLDRTKLSSCLQQVVQAGHKDAKVTVKQEGDLSVITKGSDTAYVGWVGKDVVVVSLHAEDKAMLAKWMGGKGALGKSDVGKALAQVNTAAPVWGAGLGEKELEPGIKLTGGFGAITYAKGNVSADVHAMMGGADQASKFAASATQQLEQLRQVPQVPAALAALAKAVTIVAEKDQIRIKASLPEADLIGALSGALGAGF